MDTGDEEDVWSLKTILRDLKNEGDDLSMRKDKMMTQIQRVQAGRVALNTNTSKITASYEPRTTTSSARSPETSSRLPPARKYEGAGGRSRYALFPSQVLILASVCLTDLEISINQALQALLVLARKSQLSKSSLESLSLSKLRESMRPRGMQKSHKLVNA